MKSWRRNPDPRVRPAEGRICRGNIPPLRRRSRFACWVGATFLVLAGVVGGSGSAARAASIELSLVDGATARGEWQGVREGRLTISVHGASRTFALDDVVGARLLSASSVEPALPAVFFLADGGRLYGGLAGEGQDALSVRSLVGEALAIRFDRLAGVRLGDPVALPAAAEVFAQTQRQRLAGQDLLVALGEEQVRVLPGRLIRLGPEGGAFRFGDRERTFTIDKAFGVIFATGARPEPTYPVTVALVDGSEVSGSLRSADERSLTLYSSLELDLVIPLEKVAALRLRSSRVVYLSDLPTRSERVEGRLHRPGPVRRDLNATGGAMMLGGVVYPKGLGVHSRAELIFDLGGKFERFVSVVGIDDGVRPRGSVEFVVQGDERELFSSGLLTGTDAPRELNVDVRGVEFLTLLTNYGDDLDLADVANWAGARLLRPSPDPNVPTQ